MAFYPHTATPAAGYAGYGTGAGSVGPQLPTHPSTTGNQAIYHLNNALPPPSISEPGINSLDDIVTNKPGRLILKLRYNFLKYFESHITITKYTSVAFCFKIGILVSLIYCTIRLFHVL